MTKNRMIKTPFGDINPNSLSNHIVDHIPTAMFVLMIPDYDGIYINIIIGVLGSYLSYRYFSKDSLSLYYVWRKPSYKRLFIAYIFSFFLFGILVHYDKKFVILFLFLVMTLLLTFIIKLRPYEKELFNGKVDFSEFKGWEENKGKLNSQSRVK